MKFGWFGNQEHRVFHYHPRYYDENKEELRQKFGHHDESPEKDQKSGVYIPGSHLQGAFRNGNYARRKTRGKIARIISLIGLFLFFGILFMTTKFFSLL